MAAPWEQYAASKKPWEAYGGADDGGATWGTMTPTASDFEKAKRAAIASQGTAWENVKQGVRDIITPAELPDNRILSKEYLTENVPRSLAGLPRKLAEGVVTPVYQAAKSITDPALQAAYAVGNIGDQLTGGNGRRFDAEIARIEAQKKSMGQVGSETAQGAAQFIGAPLGLYGAEAASQSWNDPASSLLAVAPIAKGVAKGTTAAVKSVIPEPTSLARSALKPYNGESVTRQRNVSNALETAVNDKNASPRMNKFMERNLAEMEDIGGRQQVLLDEKGNPRVSIQGIRDALQGTIDEARNTPGTADAAVSAADTVLKDVLNHPDFKVVDGVETIPLNTVQTMKKNIWKTLREKNIFNKDVVPGLNDAMWDAATGMNEIVNKYIPEMADENARYGELAEVNKLLKRAIDRNANNNIIPLRAVIQFARGDWSGFAQGMGMWAFDHPTLKMFVAQRLARMKGRPAPPPLVDNITNKIESDIKQLPLNRSGVMTGDSTLVTPVRPDRPIAGLLPNDRGANFTTGAYEGEVIPPERPVSTQANSAPIIEGEVVPQGLLPNYQKQLPPPTIQVNPNGTAITPADVQGMQAQGMTDSAIKQSANKLAVQAQEWAKQNKTPLAIGAAVTAYNLLGDDENKFVTGMGAIAPLAMGSIRTYPKTISRVTNALNVQAAAEGAPRVNPGVVSRYFKDLNNIAKTVINKSDVLDYAPIDSFSALKSNSDPAYTKSLDFSTLCTKRYIMQATVDAIQKRTGEFLDADGYMQVRKMLQDKGVETSCGACYVDSRRINMSTVLNKAANGYEQTNAKTGTKTPVAPLNVPKDMLLTNEGITADMPTQFPEEYAKLRKTFGGTQMKIPEGRTEYRGEIAEISPNDVQKMNRASGLRWQSWSDFELPHVLDSMEAVGDMATQGLKGQAYTKVPAFVETLGDTGMAINMSMIPKGTGFDASGKLVWDASQSFPLDQAVKFRKQHPNAGIISIGVSDAHIKALLADPRVDYVIPYHMSGLKEGFRDMMGMKDWKDYTSEEGWRDAQTGKKVDDVNRYVFINEYKGDLKTLDKLAQERGVVPPFSRMRNWTGYEKLITDRRIFDNEGNYYEQQPVQPVFNTSVINKRLKEYKGGKYAPDMDTVNAMVSSLGVQK